MMKGAPHGAPFFVQWDGEEPSQSPAVTAPPKGEPRLIPGHTHFEAGLPLPAGEVAMP